MHKTQALPRRPHRPRLAVLGSSNTDLVIECPRLPAPGETVLGQDLKPGGGGKGANQAVAAARAGARVAFIGAHGEDAFGRAARANLRREGIDTRHFRPRAGKASGAALILLGGKGRENLIAVAPGANASLRAADLKPALTTLAQSDCLLMQLEIPLAVVRAATRHAKAMGLPVILNPAPIPEKTSEREDLIRLLPRVHVLTPNAEEARQLTGCRSEEAAALTLLKWGCRHVAITLGARGVLIASATQVSEPSRVRAEIVRIASPRVKPIDTVGAGDCFSAWLAVGLAEGLNLVDAATRACRAAALKVTRPGAQTGMPTLRDLARRGRHVRA